MSAFRRAADPESSITYMGSLISFLARGNETAGRFALVEWKARPGNEPPPHLHLWENELYYILEGEAEFHCGIEKFLVHDGEVVFLPQGEAHALYILSQVFRALILVQATDEQPVGLDLYFAEMGEPAKAMSMPSGASTHAMVDPSHATSVAALNGTRILSPEETTALLPNYPGFGINPSARGSGG